jgi:hypothetical protein
VVTDDDLDEIDLLIVYCDSRGSKSPTVEPPGEGVCFIEGSYGARDSQK